MELFDISGFKLPEEDICHHGIKGQKWGVRRYQNPDGSLTPEGYKRYAESNLRKARTSNLDKWRTDPEHNVCYVAGYSGSGKSTTALSIKKPGDFVIHLDAYSVRYSSATSTIENSEFNKYLDTHVSNWRKMRDATLDGNSETMKLYTPEYWDTVDSFRKALEDFGKEQFKNGHGVIVEGVQIADDWLAADKTFYKDKPMIILNTPAVTSLKRALDRDDKSLLDKDFRSVKELIQWYAYTNRNLDNLAAQNDIEKGKKYVKQL